MTLWLIGAGPMARDYARVLEALDVQFEVIGRGVDSASDFTREVGRRVRIGGLAHALRTATAPDKAIIATDVIGLASAATQLLHAGVKHILIEKPGGLNLSEIESLNELAETLNALVFVGYNRRFYNSVRMARDIINDDGGVLSAQFEFTELSHKVATLPKSVDSKERWVIGNSSHVIDLVFDLVGRPNNWRCWHAGSLAWHPASARFAGAGITEKNVMFSYLADWEAPGRWGIELLTRTSRIILRPMEVLQVVPLGSFDAEIVKS